VPLRTPAAPAASGLHENIVADARRKNLFPLLNQTYSGKKQPLSPGAAANAALFCRLGVIRALPYPMHF
jgi:hypothetical protein